MPVDELVSVLPLHRFALGFERDSARERTRDGRRARHHETRRESCRAIILRVNDTGRSFRGALHSNSDLSKAHDEHRDLLVMGLRVLGNCS